MQKFFIGLLAGLMFFSEGQCQNYTHAKEQGLKGKIKILKEYSYEAYKGADSNFHKRSERYYALSITDFNELGNMVAKTEYSYNTNFTTSPANDAIASIAKTVYSYRGTVCTGYTRYLNNVRTTLCERTMRGDYGYTDSIYAFIQPGDKQSQLVSVTTYFYNKDYHLDSTNKSIFYDIETGTLKDSKKITVYLVTAGHNKPYSMQLLEDEHPQRDKQGNRLEDVYVYFEGDTREYEISRYEYEYY